MSDTHWKVGNEFAPYHKSASHCPPDYRDGWNNCYEMASAQIATLEQQVLNGIRMIDKYEAECDVLTDRAEAAESKVDALMREKREQILTPANTDWGRGMFAVVDLVLPIANGGASTTASGTPDIKEMVLAERKKGNVVFWALPGQLTTMSVEDIVGQSADGLLYDLNRLEEVVLTFIDDPKWVNDFAVAQVIRKLVEQRNAAMKVDGTAPETSTRSADE